MCKEKNMQNYDEYDVLIKGRRGGRLKIGSVHAGLIQRKGASEGRCLVLYLTFYGMLLSVLHPLLHPMLPLFVNQHPPSTIYSQQGYHIATLKKIGSVSVRSVYES